MKFRPHKILCYFGFHKKRIKRKLVAGKERIMTVDCKRCGKRLMNINEIWNENTKESDDAKTTSSN